MQNYVEVLLVLATVGQYYDIFFKEEFIKYNQ